jgi:hypothetical protein
MSLTRGEWTHASNRQPEKHRKGDIKRSVGRCRPLMASFSLKDSSLAEDTRDTGEK